MQICLENLHRQNKRQIGTVYQLPGYHHKYFSQRPERSVTLYDSYRGTLLKPQQPFADLQRQEFSQDYLDISDLSRAEQNCQLTDCQNHYFQNENIKRKLKDLNKLDNRRVFEHVDLRSYSSDENSASSESDNSYNIKPNKKVKKPRKPSRFEVVNNDDSSQESETETKKRIIKSSVESEEYSKKKKPKSKKIESVESEEHVKKKPKNKREKKIEVNSDSDIDVDDEKEVKGKPTKSKEKYAYLQGNKIYDSLRRQRLQHFLPKRFHWTENEMRNLGYYWFDS